MNTVKVSYSVAHSYSLVCNNTITAHLVMVDLFQSAIVLYILTFEFCFFTVLLILIMQDLPVSGRDLISV